MEIQALKEHLGKHFGGLLLSGDHPQDGEVCLLEADHHMRGEDWGDAPGSLPDLRELNDAPWSSDEARTENLLKVWVAYYDWSAWSDTRKTEVIGRVALWTVNRILPIALDAIGIESDACREATDLVEAARAAEAAWAAAGAGAWVARAAKAGADETLGEACSLWVEAAGAVGRTDGQD